MKVKIIADSGCDLPKQILDNLNIEMMPLIVQADGEEFLDRKTIEPVQLYNKMRNGSAPKTAQVSPLTIKETISTYAKENIPVIYITLSSGLSGTYQTAVLMNEEIKEEFPEAQSAIFDSLGASLGYGLMVYEAALLAEKGESIETILSMLEQFRDSLQYIFTVDDLEYLFRGGRVSKTAAFMGSLLKIKPVLHMKDGKLFPLEKVRGRKKSFSRMLELMKERTGDTSKMTIAISHGDDIESANLLKEMIKDEFKTNEIIINMIGGAVGAHAGPGTVALFFLSKPVRS
ncbi:DegV family protein [Fictibacillus aquaticus]|uniref:Fatty acid-binding protein DegV n=1 Tax=Fictibacillus aquaticus TaxID=2021314 RepID=A0A235FEB0_9BACL|nr:DegV family protein [Fictibacillus aquaticus]OYD59095.1 fatty acid-binding protein DegV [Fictibacillus aquaticus]